MKVLRWIAALALVGATGAFAQQAPLPRPMPLFHAPVASGGTAPATPDATAAPLEITAPPAEPAPTPATEAIEADTADPQPVTLPPW